MTTRKEDRFGMVPGQRSSTPADGWVDRRFAFVLLDREALDGSSVAAPDPAQQTFVFPFPSPTPKDAMPSDWCVTTTF